MEHIEQKQIFVKKPFILEDGWLYIPNGEYNAKNYPKNLKQCHDCIAKTFRNPGNQKYWITDDFQFIFYDNSGQLTLWSQKRQIQIKSFGLISTTYNNWIELNTNMCPTNSDPDFRSKISKNHEMVNIKFSDQSRREPDNTYRDYEKIAINDLPIDLYNKGLLFGSFRWKDQGFGNRKGHIQALLKKNSSENQTYELFNIGAAPHEYSIANFCINLNELERFDLNKNDEIVFRVRNGHGGGHSILIKEFGQYTSDILSQKWAKAYQTKPIEEIVKKKPNSVSKDFFEKKFTKVLSNLVTKPNFNNIFNYDKQKSGWRKGDMNWHDFETIDVSMLENLRVKGAFKWIGDLQGDMTVELKILYLVNGLQWAVLYDAGRCPQDWASQEFFIVYDRPGLVSETDRCEVKVVYRGGEADEQRCMNIKEFLMDNYCDEKNEKVGKNDDLKVENSKLEGLKENSKIKVDTKVVGKVGPKVMKVEKNDELKVENSKAGNSKVDGLKDNYKVKVDLKVVGKVGPKVTPKLNGKAADKKIEEKKQTKPVSAVAKPKPTSARPDNLVRRSEAKRSEPGRSTSNLKAAKPTNPTTTATKLKPQSLVRLSIETSNLQKTKPSTPKTTTTKPNPKPQSFVRKSIETSNPQKTKPSTPKTTNPKPQSVRISIDPSNPQKTKPSTPKTTNPKPQSFLRKSVDTSNLQKPKPSTATLRTSTSKNLERVQEAPTKSRAKTPKKLTDPKQQTSPRKIAQTIRESKKDETKQPKAIKSTVIDKSKKVIEDKKSKDDTKASVPNKPPFKKIINKPNPPAPTQKKSTQPQVAANPVPPKVLAKKQVPKDEPMVKKQIGKYEVKTQVQAKKTPFTGFGKKVVETVPVKGKNPKTDEIEGLFVRKYMDELYKKAVLVCSGSR